MKKTLMIIALILFACGGGGTDTQDDQDTPVTPVAPHMKDIVRMACLDVANDSLCDALEDSPGVFNSGSVSISGSPMPRDYMNMRLVNAQEYSATVFVHTDIAIDGCLTQERALEAVLLQPEDSVEYSISLWGYMCGNPGPNSSLVTIYNTAHFNPADYVSAYDYPRDQAIANAVVHWTNVGAGG